MGREREREEGGGGEGGGVRWGERERGGGGVIIFHTNYELLTFGTKEQIFLWLGQSLR